MPVKFWIGFRAPRRLSAPASEGRGYPNGFCLNGQDAGTVILIHGLTGTPNEMKALGSLLHRRGDTVTCPRLANHGQPIEVLKTTTWEDCYQSVRNTLLRIEAEHCPRPIFVSGLSMGALLALVLAEEFPTQIAGVSCLSPTLFYDGWNMPWSKHLLPLVYPTPFKRWFYFKEEPPYGIKN